MIDFHTHILPGIDDGSRDIDMTIAMLESEREQGVSHIYATPHFYAHKRSVNAFLERRNRAFDLVLKELGKRPDLPRITVGAEVYYFNGIGMAEHLPELCIEDTNILLLEMPFDQWTNDMAREVEALVRKKRLKVVLAHADRYVRLQYDKDVWDRILSMPLTIQINTESIINAGTWLRPNLAHKWCMRFLAEHGNCIIGSDCHNLTDRKPDIAKARALIKQKEGEDRLVAMDRYIKQLLGL